MTEWPDSVREYDEHVASVGVQVSGDVAWSICDAAINDLKDGWERLEWMLNELLRLGANPKVMKEKLEREWEKRCDS